VTVNHWVAGSNPAGGVKKVRTMITVRCKQCQTELASKSKVQVCGCPNRMEIINDKISAADLSKVIIVTTDKHMKSEGVLKPEDLHFQEQRRKRKVKKLKFEVR
tara:strand:- start:131 stop:442 length:312 start_codon:yes stop_codon:yes gene_type:complete